MIIYLTVVDECWDLGNQYDEEWSCSEILGAFSNFEAAKECLAFERARIIKDNPNLNENNFYEYIKKSIEYDTHVLMQYKSMYPLVEVLAGQTEWYANEYIAGPTYIHYIKTMTVEDTFAKKVHKEKEE